jgi:hypothetical protein
MDPGDTFYTLVKGESPGFPGLSRVRPARFELAASASAGQRSIP